MVREYFQYIYFYVIIQVYLINQQIKAEFISSESQKSLLIYQPYPTLIIDAETYSPGDYIVASKDFIYQNKRYLAVSFYSSGFAIFELNQELSCPPVLILKHFDSFNNQQTGLLSLSHSDTLLWVSYGSGKVDIVNINVLPFQIINSYSLQNNISLNIVVPWPEDNNYLIFLCQGVFQTFFFNQTTAELSFLSKQDLHAREASQIEFNKQNQYAFICTPDFGVQIYKVVLNTKEETQNLSFNYLCAIKPIYYDILYFSLLHNDCQIAIVAQFGGVFIHDLTQFFEQGGYSGQCALITQISQSVTEGLGGRMALSNDGRFLFTSFRSVGVKIYDVINNTFQIVQSIEIEGNSKEVTLSSDEQILFYVNSLSLYLFEQTDPNFNQDQPNLLLNHNYMISYGSYKEDKVYGNLDYSCVYDESSKLLYVSRAQYGTAVFSYPTTGLIDEVSFINRTPSRGPTSYTAFLQNGKQAYICQGISGLSLIDFTDPKNPIVMKSNLTFNATYVQFLTFQFLKTFKYAFLANFMNMLVLDSSDQYNLSIISIIDTQEFTLGGIDLTWFVFSSDQKYIYLQLLTYGVVITDISNPLNPQNLQKYPFQYLTDLRITSDDKYLILGGGYKGLEIVSLGENQKPTFLSGISFFGSILFLRLFPGDNYLLATTNENPSIQLINIKDKSQPFAIQRLSKASDFGYYDICFSNDNSYAFITGQFALYILFFRNNISIHTQIYQIIPVNGSKDYTRQVMQNGEIMKVGQQFELNFVPIYQSPPLKIRKAYFYDNFQLTDLPYWINFNQDTGVIILKISKDSLSKSQSGEYLQEEDACVVIQADQQIKDDSFQNSHLGLSLSDSQFLLQACQQEGYIDKDGYIRQNLSIDNIFEKGYADKLYFQQWPNSSEIKEFLRVVLSKSTTLQSIFFWIAPSIQFDIDQRYNPIYSLQQSIAVTLSIASSLQHQDQAIHLLQAVVIFTQANYQGALILFNEQQTQIKIEGTLDNVNSIFNQGIQLYIADTNIDLQSFQIDIDLSDGVNYDFSSSNTIQELDFITIKSYVEISGSTIQSYFDRKFPDSKISILQNLNFVIDSNFCSNKDSDQIIYSAQLIIDGKAQDIPRNSWLQYSQSEGIFSGIPTTSVFMVQYTIQIKGTDGYSSCIDTFTFTVELIPFVYVLQLTVQILGPVIGLVGLARYRSFIYNAIYKEKYTYSKEEVAVGDMYVKQIPITGDLHEKAQYLANLFLSSHSVNQIEQEISLAKKPDSLQINSQYISSGKIDQSVKIKMDQSSQVMQNNNTIEQNLKYLQRNVSKSIYNKTENGFNNDHTKRFMRSLSFAVNKASGKANKILNEQQKLKTTQHIISNTLQQFILEDGSLNRICILNEISMKFKEMNKKKKKQSKIIDDQDVENMRDSKSGLSQAVCSMIFAYIITQDSIGTCLLNGLKVQSIQDGNKEIDWYKGYVDIQINFTDLFKNPFPILQIRKEKINSTFKSIINSLTEQIPPQRLKICFTLVEEALIALALGFTIKKPRFNEKSQGEAIHVKPNEMYSVRSYQLDQRSGIGSRFYQYFNMHHIQKALSDNQRLPSWIDTVDLINNTLIIRGTPELKDVGSYIFKLYTSSGYILRSFELEVIKRGFDLQNLQINQDYSFSINPQKKFMKFQLQDKGRQTQQCSQSNEISIIKTIFQSIENSKTNDNSIAFYNQIKYNQEQFDIQNSNRDRSYVVQDEQMTTQLSPRNQICLDNEFSKKIQDNITKGYQKEFFGDEVLGSEEDPEIQHQ